MIVIGYYATLEDAQNDANKLVSRGVKAYIVDASGGSLIPGIGPAFELQIDPQDRAKLEALSDNIHRQKIDERKHSCPECGSKDYKSIVPFSELIFGAITALCGGRSGMNTSLWYRCLECSARFRISP